MKRWIAALSALMVLTACSAKDGGSDNAYYYTSEGIADAGNAAYDEYESPAMQAEEYKRDEESGTESTLTGEKLVYTGRLDIETLDYDETLKNIRAWISQYGVMIENENAYDYDNSWRGYSSRGTRSLSMTLRVPSDSFYPFINDMQGTGKVTSLSTNIENITKRYSSVSTEIESLEIQQKRLLQMLESAQTVEDMITVERRLSEVESSLKQYRNMLSDMDTDIQYSTVYLNVREVMVYTETNNDLYTGNFGQRFISTLQWTGTFFVWLVQQFILTVIRLIPVAAVAAPVLWGLKKLLELLKKRRAARKAAKAEKIM